MERTGSQVGRKKIVAFIACALSASLLAPAHVAASSDRSVTRDYTISRGYLESGSDEDLRAGSRPEVFRPRDGERWVTIALSDRSGAAVGGRVESGSWVVEFCSATSKPLRVVPGQKIEVSALVGECGGAPSAATEGQIEVTFSR